MNINNFLVWEKRSRDSIDVKRCYIDVAGDLITGVLLSQIIYWHLPDDQGQSKLKVFHEGHYWIAKKREDWWHEIRISVKQFDRAITALEEKGLVITDVFKFNGNPTKHIRLKWDNLFQALNALPDMVITQRGITNLPSENDTSTTEENRYYPNGNLDIAQRGITKLPKGENTYIDPENTTKITTKITAEITPPTPSVELFNVERSGSVSEQPQVNSASEQTCKLKPDGSEWFPWELVDSVKGWVIEEGFLKYVANVVKDYPVFKNLPSRRFAREVFNFLDKAHFDGERKSKIFGYWQDYQAGDTDEPDVTIAQLTKQAEQQSELERIRNACKRKFEL